MSVGIAMRIVRAAEGVESAAWEVSFIHMAVPKSKSRPKFDARRGRGRAYTPAESRAAEDHLAMSWRLALRGETHDGGLAVACVFYRPNRQRIDVDNMVKLVLDAGTKARAWYDDCQVVAIMARIELDAASPRTEVALIPSTSTLDRSMFKTSACSSCGKSFTIATSDIVTKSKRATKPSPGNFCSRLCAQASRRVVARCTHCGCEFKRQRAAQSMCSRRCSDANAPSRSAQMIADGKRPPGPKCSSCGGRVSRREYLKCSACHGFGRPKGSKNATIAPADKDRAGQIAAQAVRR